MGIVAIGRSELIARERNKRRQMRAGRIANEADAVWVEVEFARLGAHKLDGRFGVIDRGGVNALFGQPVFDGKKRVAVAGKKRTPILVEIAGADLPPAAMDRHQNRRFAAAFGQIEIADKLDPVVLGKNEVGGRG